MKIIIAGAGDVGSHLAKLLSNEEQDILVIDQNSAKIDILDANYNLMTMAGSPTTFKTLREAGVGTCDLFIAVTPYETDNVTACSIAKRLGAKRTVGRIDSYDYMDPRNAALIKEMGVDSLIYPEYVAAQEIISALNRSWVRNWFELHDGEIIVVGVKLRANAPLAGMQLKEFASSQHNFHVSAIRRNHEIIIPRGDDRMMVGDILYFTTTRDYVDKLVSLCGKKEYKIRRVMIMGGGKIAIRLARMAADKFKMKIIEADIDVCRRLPELCPDVEIVHGDARNIDVLVDEGIDETDAFIALSDSSEANILACLTAKELEVKKTIAEVENMHFISQAENLNIGTIINKKLLASSKIFQLLLDSDASTSRCLALADAEVTEIEARPGSKITKAPVKDLRLAREMTIAGLVREGKGMLVTGNTVIRPGDFVVVFCLSGMLHKVEKLFT